MSISRRGFLKGGAATAAVLAFPGAALADDPSERPPQFTDPTEFLLAQYPNFMNVKISIRRLSSMDDPEAVLKIDQETSPDNITHDNLEYAVAVTEPPNSNDDQYILPPKPANEIYDEITTKILNILDSIRDQRFIFTDDVVQIDIFITNEKKVTLNMSVDYSLDGRDAFINKMRRNITNTLDMLVYGVIEDDRKRIECSMGAANISLLSGKNLSWRQLRDIENICLHPANP